MSHHCLRLCLLTILTGIAIALLSGCEKSPDPKFRFNSVEFLKLKKTLRDEDSFDPKYVDEIGSILTATFGTPNDPKFPFLVGEADPAHEFIDIEKLRLAAGPVAYDDSGKPVSGLYREHCSHCHGITGDGAGPPAEFLNPYPRDFRMSMFKFKKTPLRQRPTDEDLTEILRNGIPGTAMPSFRTMPQEEVDSLIAYVKYLTIRGQFERFLISEVNAMEGEPILDFSMNVAANNGATQETSSDDSDDGEMSDEDKQEYYDDRMAEVFGDGLIEGIIGKWLDTEDAITEVGEPPVAMDDSHPDHSDLVEQGRVLFYTKGNCAQCHGDTAYGDGQTSNFDEWTNDWIKSSGGIDPFDKETFRDFLTAGAMLPRTIPPRNLREFVYRGGGHLDDLYIRIANGIEGTPMPSSSALSAEETWAVVAYVRSLPFEHATAKPAKPVNEHAIAK